MKFDKLLESLLLEMPHTYIGDTYLDLEVERYEDTKKGYNEFLTNVNRLLNGEIVKTKISDREGTTYFIPKEHKTDFEDYLKTDTILAMLISKRFQSQFKGFLEGLHDEEKNSKVIEKFQKDLTYIQMSNSEKEAKI